MLETVSVVALLVVLVSRLYGRRRSTAAWRELPDVSASAVVGLVQPRGGRASARWL